MEQFYFCSIFNTFSTEILCVYGVEYKTAPFQHQLLSAYRNKDRIFDTP